MQLELNPKRQYKWTMLFFAGAVVLTSVMAVILLGELMLPIASAFLAAIFVFESKERRILSFLIPAFIILLDLLYGGLLSYISVEICIFALILTLSVSRGASKAECAFWLTFTAVSFVAVSMIMGVISATGSVTVDSFFEYYTGLAEQLKAVFTEAFQSSLAGASDFLSEITAEDAAAIFDMMLSTLISVVVICAFVISGLTLKIFCFFLRNYSEPSVIPELKRWRFAVPKVVNYFFWILVVVNIFVGYSNDLFGIAVVNLYNIFLVIFAYLGFRVVTAFLSVIMKRRAVAVITVVALILFLSSLAVEILAYFGASAAIFVRRGGNDDQNK